MTRNIEARPSMLGYQFQIEYALLLLMKSGLNTKLSIEKIDDIQLDTEGDPLEILQLKHGIRGEQASLENKSPQLWKTIGNWSQLVKTKQVSNDVSLSLVTTARATDDSVAAMLRPLRSRDNHAIAGQLALICQDSTSQSLKQYFDYFLALSENEREQLVSHIQLLDQAPTVWQTEEVIKDVLRLQEYPDDVDGIYDQLRMWWARRVLNHLKNKDDIIRRVEYVIELKRIREFFTAENLPLNFEEAEPPQEWFDNQQRYHFVQQLTLIELERPEIERAIRDYFRAFQERTKWLDESRVQFSELQRYENRLVEHWEIFVSALRHRLSDYMESDQKKKNFGRNLYDEMMLAQTIAPLRRNISADYIKRGNFQILANHEPTPRVWWHPDFLERLQAILTMPAEEAFTIAPETGLPPWRLRSIEIANMLNPAFCSVILYDAIRGYQEEKPLGMPFALMRLIFPVVLHAPTRNLLPKSVRTKLHVWLQTHPEIKADFQIGYEEFQKITSEAIMFALNKETITKLDGSDIFAAVPNLKLLPTAKNSAGVFSSDVFEIRKLSQRLGRMLALAGEITSIYIWFEVRA